MSNATPTTKPGSTAIYSAEGRRAHKVALSALRAKIAARREDRPSVHYYADDFARWLHLRRDGKIVTQISGNPGTIRIVGAA